MLQCDNFGYTVLLQGIKSRQNEYKVMMRRNTKTYFKIYFKIDRYRRLWTKYNFSFIKNEEIFDLKKVFVWIFFKIFFIM